MLYDTETVATISQGPVKKVTKDPCIGKEYSADPKNCNVFYQCNGGKMIKLPCPPGLHWNQKATMCDWPEKVNRPECPASGNGMLQISFFQLGSIFKFPYRFVGKLEILQTKKADVYIVVAFSIYSISQISNVQYSSQFKWVHLPQTCWSL